MDTTETITHISLCSGYGGIDLGLKRCIRLRTVAYSEIEAFAIELLLARMEAGQLDAAPIWSDLKTFPWSEFRDRVDILSGGFPCQPFSSAGKRAGDEDPRHLFPYILEGIRQCRPAIVFLENVEGIVSAKLAGDGWRDPARTPVLLHVHRELERVGYRTAAGIFSASEIGAPHQRRRVFILAHSNGAGLEKHIARLSIPKGWEMSSGSTYGGCGSSRAWELAHSNSPGSREDRQSSEPRTASTQQSSCVGRRSDEEEVCERKVWPSRPGEPQHAWEPPRVVNRQTQPALGRDADGPTGGLDYAQLCVSCVNRTDELRLLGNGVVPQTAALAFRILLNEINNN